MVLENTLLLPGTGACVCLNLSATFFHDEQRIL